MNKKLKDSANNVNPEKDEFEALVNSVDAFTSALINPLKSDSDTRNTFQSCFDHVVEEAINTEQKKVLRGSFVIMRYTICLSLVLV